MDQARVSGGTARYGANCGCSSRIWPSSAATGTRRRGGPAPPKLPWQAGRNPPAFRNEARRGATESRNRGPGRQHVASDRRRQDGRWPRPCRLHMRAGMRNPGQRARASNPRPFRSVRSTPDDRSPGAWRGRELSHSPATDLHGVRSSEGGAGRAMPPLQRFRSQSVARHVPMAVSPAGRYRPVKR